MRGLTADELGILSDCLTPDRCGRDGLFSASDEAVADRLELRGLLRWVDCGNHQHARLTRDGELMLRVAAALRGAA